MSRRLIFAIFAFTAAQAAVYVARPMTSYRLLAIGSGARAVGLVAAAFALVPLFLAIPLGRFLGRHRRAPLLAAGCGVQLVGCLALAWATTAVTLAAATVVLGLGHLALALGVQNVIALESDDEHHDQHFGLMTAGVSLGQLVGPVLGGVLLSARGNASMTSATGAALLVAAGVAAVATACAAVADRARAAAVPEDDVPSRGSIRTIARTRGVAAGIFASVAVLSAADVFTAYMPVIGEQHDIAPTVVGVLLGIRAGASLVSRAGVGTLVRWAGRLRVMTVSALGAAAALAAVPLTDNVVALAVLSGVAGLGLGFGQPLSMTIVVQLVPEHARATALALRLTGNRLGQVAVPAAAGVAAGSSGVSSVFWLMSAVVVASGLAIRRPGLEGRARRAPSEEAVAEAAVE